MMATPILTPEFTKIAENLALAEGPVFDSKGNFYVVAPGAVFEENKIAGNICKIGFNPTKVEVFSEPAEDYVEAAPCGCQADKDGNLYVADMRLGVLFVQPDGKAKQIATTDESGETMKGCNDCAFDYDGNLWVTAPCTEIYPGPLSMDEDCPDGALYCLTKDGRMINLGGKYAFPNGIAVIHDKDRKPVKLIVAETKPRSLFSFDIEGPGKISNKTLWGKLPVPDPDIGGGPDGIDFDENGNLLVAHHRGGHIEVFGPQGGDPIARIKCPFNKPSNLHFRPGTSTVYVTEHDNNALWSFEWERAGMPQYCDI